MALDTFIDTEQTTERAHRIFATDFKQHLVELCLQPDTSVAKVTMQHQINANLLHKWIRQSRSMVHHSQPPPFHRPTFFPSFFTRHQSNKKHRRHLNRKRMLSLISEFHCIRNNAPQEIR
ncbi:transposase [Acinetobacter schindleri]|uniref:transposase n=1 Tax=Acinetobacter schindleri TaxID=108981 RepID=UPI00333E4A98